MKLVNQSYLFAVVPQKVLDYKRRKLSPTTWPYFLGGVETMVPVSLWNFHLHQRFEDQIHEVQEDDGTNKSLNTKS